MMMRLNEGGSMDKRLREVVLCRGRLATVCPKGGREGGLFRSERGSAMY